MSVVALSDKIVVDDSQGLLDEYRSRPKQLARWLLLSRDQLREKYKATKVELKRLKVRPSLSHQPQLFKWPVQGAWVRSNPMVQKLDGLKLARAAGVYEMMPRFCLIRHRKSCKKGC